MLSFAEEIYLLALDDVTGKISTYSEEVSLSYALIGAVLCELSFMNKIDTDPDHLYVIDKEPTGNKILDFVLKTISESEKPMPISYWLKVLLSDASRTEDLVLNHLIERGILKRVDERIFWVFHTRRYPVINNKEIKNVEERLRELVLGDEIPEPREAVLVSLVQACNLFEDILSPREKKRAEKRIQAIAKLDIVGREVVEMIKEIKNFNPSIFC
ncbi:MAG: GPP34 family phosphoprotein [Victivallales bacterium]|nr:GPP34 family phosphoprotein [Victivallales bacterium]MCF7889007.1 GPP34 family phosphoprotein [Victivallales bacterium]